MDPDADARGTTAGGLDSIDRDALAAGEARQQTREPWCEHCGDDPNTFCSYCSI